MKNFKASPLQVKALLIMYICSFIIIIIGIGELIYYNNHYCSDLIKISGIFYLIGGVLFQISAILTYLNTTVEVILNENDICINKPGFTNAKSLLIDYKYVSSVSYTEKDLAIISRAVTTITLNTNMGVKKIVNIEDAKKCAGMIQYRIINGSFENYDLKTNKDNSKAFYYNEEGVLNAKTDKENALVDIIKNREMNENQLKCKNCGNIQSNTIKRCLKCGYLNE